MTHGCKLLTKKIYPPLPWLTHATPHCTHARHTALTALTHATLTHARHTDSLTHATLTHSFLHLHFSVSSSFLLGCCSSSFLFFSSAGVTLLSLLGESRSCLHFFFKVSFYFSRYIHFTVSRCLCFFFSSSFLCTGYWTWRTKLSDLVISSLQIWWFLKQTEQSKHRSKRSKG